MTHWQPIAPDAVAARLADWLAATPGTVRVAVDGPPATGPDELAAALRDELQARGRPAAQIRAACFWRDASLRLEHGRHDVESYLSWLDAPALRREVLEPVVAEPAGYLPSLRDPDTNRSTRAAPVPAAPGLALLVSGTLLLRHDLPFDRTVHLAMSSAARARRTSDAEAWTLPAYDSYDAEVRPAETADVVIKLDDPARPALRWT
ncbi:MAG: hypothetical protein QOH89_2651 [Pseudonocardiales bacterium]|nr:hypothetical protein [Pseudonocardiales bacterium]MDT4942612.1 hypothetical protein [Pseudonocardiales bacterium]